MIDSQIRRLKLIQEESGKDEELQKQIKELQKMRRNVKNGNYGPDDY